MDTHSSISVNVDHEESVPDKNDQTAHSYSPSSMAHIEDVVMSVIRNGPTTIELPPPPTQPPTTPAPKDEVKVNEPTVSGDQKKMAGSSLSELFVANLFSCQVHVPHVKPLNIPNEVWQRLFTNSELGGASSTSRMACGGSATLESSVTQLIDACRLQPIKVSNIKDLPPPSTIDEKIELRTHRLIPIFLPTAELRPLALKLRRTEGGYKSVDASKQKKKSKRNKERTFSRKRSKDVCEPIDTTLGHRTACQVQSIAQLLSGRSPTHQPISISSQARTDQSPDENKDHLQHSNTNKTSLIHKQSAANKTSPIQKQSAANKTSPTSQKQSADNKTSPIQKQSAANKPSPSQKQCAASLVSAKGSKLKRRHQSADSIGQSHDKRHKPELLIRRKAPKSQEFLNSEGSSDDEGKDKKTNGTAETKKEKNKMEAIKIGTDRSERKPSSSAKLSAKEADAIIEKQVQLKVNARREALRAEAKWLSKGFSQSKHKSTPVKATPHRHKLTHEHKKRKHESKDECGVQRKVRALADGKDSMQLKSVVDRKHTSANGADKLVGASIPTIGEAAGSSVLAAVAGRVLVKKDSECRSQFHHRYLQFKKIVRVCQSQNLECDDQGRHIWQGFQSLAHYRENPLLNHGMLTYIGNDQLVCNLILKASKVRRQFVCQREGPRVSKRAASVNRFRNVPTYRPADVPKTEYDKRMANQQPSAAVPRTNYHGTQRNIEQARKYDLSVQNVQLDGQGERNQRAVMSVNELWLHRENSPFGDVPNNQYTLQIQSVPARPVQGHPYYAKYLRLLHSYRPEHRAKQPIARLLNATMLTVADQQNARKVAEPETVDEPRAPGTTPVQEQIGQDGMYVPAMHYTPVQQQYSQQQTYNMHMSMPYHNTPPFAGMQQQVANQYPAFVSPNQYAAPVYSPMYSGYSPMAPQANMHQQQMGMAGQGQMWSSPNAVPHYNSHYVVSSSQSITYLDEDMKPPQQHQHTGWNMPAALPPNQYPATFQVPAPPAPMSMAGTQHGDSAIPGNPPLPEDPPPEDLQHDGNNLPDFSNRVTGSNQIGHLFVQLNQVLDH